jgi:meiotically up-regulated gene 157 (Mug157) protein
MDRKHFIRQGSFATAGFFIAKGAPGISRDGQGRAGFPAEMGFPGGVDFAGRKEVPGGKDFPVVRIPDAQRKFRSIAVEKTIANVQRDIGNREIAWLFGNCFPNTLDTTVDFEMEGGEPDTYVITGDIDAMWLRDSSAQVWPYLPLCKEDKKLQQLIKGVIHRQVKCILRDPYANAFYKDENKISEWKRTDVTDMKSGIHERKWEVDGLCYPIRLSHGYWKQTGDVSAFDAQWQEAMRLIVKTFREQQRKDGQGPYTFQRNSQYATDSVPMSGYGYPTKKVVQAQ